LIKDGGHLGMKNLLMASTAIPLGLIVGPALAADLAIPVKAPVPPAQYNWTGAYVGLNAGGYVAYSGDPLTTVLGGCGSFPPDYFDCSNVPLVNAAGTGSMSGAGFIGGGQVGYNWQVGQFVYGPEFDAEWFHTRISRQVTAPYATGGTFTIGSSANTDYLLTARARLGWAFNTLLLYGTGGVAATNLSANNWFNDGVASSSWNANAFRVGWTVGAGLEWAFSKNWTAKIEYLYVNFGSVTAYGAIGTAPYANGISTTTDLSAQIARAGVNYKF